MKIYTPVKDQEVLMKNVSIPVPGRDLKGKITHFNNLWPVTIPFIFEKLTGFQIKIDGYLRLPTTVFEGLKTSSIRFSLPNPL
jgi:hypothetical protein